MMRKISFIFVILLMITLVISLGSCAKQEETVVELAAQTSTAAADPAVKTPSDDFPHDANGNIVPPLLPAIMAELNAGNIGVAFNIIMDAFVASAGVIGAVFAVLAFLCLIAVYYLGVWILL